MLRLDAIIPAVIHTQAVDTLAGAEATMGAAVDMLAVAEDTRAVIAVELTAVAAVRVVEVTDK